MTVVQEVEESARCLLLWIRLMRWEKVKRRRRRCSLLADILHYLVVHRCGQPVAQISKAQKLGACRCCGMRFDDEEEAALSSASIVSSTLLQSVARWTWYRQLFDLLYDGGEVEGKKETSCQRRACSNSTLSSDMQASRRSPLCCMSAVGPAARTAHCCPVEVESYHSFSTRQPSTRQTLKHSASIAPTTASLLSSNVSHGIAEAV